MNIKDLIKEELKGNLSVLIDPKQKNSFSDARVHIWAELVSERILLHLNK